MQRISTGITMRRVVAKQRSEEITFLLGSERAFGTYVIEWDDEVEADVIEINGRKRVVGRWPNGKAFCRLY